VTSYNSDAHVYLSATAILSLSLFLSHRHTLSFLHEDTYQTSSTLLMRMSIYLQTQFALSHSLSHTLSAFLQDVTYPISSTLSMSTALTRLSLSLSFTHTPTFLQEVTYPPSCTCLMHMSLHLQTKSSLSLSPVPSLLLAGSHFPTSSTLLIRISLSLALSYILSPSCRKSFPNIFYIIDQNLSLSRSLLHTLSFLQEVISQHLLHY